MLETTLAKQESKAKAYLRSVQHAQRALTLAQTENKEQRAAIDGLRAVCYDRVGGHTTRGAGDDQMMQILERLERIEQAVQDKAADYAAALEEWHTIGERMDAQAFELLDAHYIKGEGWEHIADRIHVSRRTIFRERLMALCDLYQEMPPSWH